MADRPVGYLVINVLESAGHDNEDKPVWGDEFTQGHARGEPQSVRVAGGACVSLQAMKSGVNCRRRVAAHLVLPLLCCCSLLCTLLHTPCCSGDSRRLENNQGKLQYTCLKQRPTASCHVEGVNLGKLSATDLLFKPCATAENHQHASSGR